MRKVKTDSIDPEGQTIALEVTGPSGNVLLGKGASITPALGRRLRNWGVDFVFVEGEDDCEESVKIKAKTPEEIKNELYDLFLGTLDNVRMRTIFDAVYTHKLRKLDGGLEHATKQDA
ncbi:MAG: hypothetical protein LBU70_02095 [Chitinispirillales bacterium]|nr:hypothetical protein [Chitinispirillales bacterium]